MDFEDTSLEAAFRAEVRHWLREHAGPHQIPEGTRLEEAEEVRRGRQWQRTLAAGGYAGILLPKSVGGRGGTLMEAVIFAEEQSRYRLPTGAYIGIGLAMALPVIHKHGTPQQIERFAGPTLRGELTWCQLFSEPAAGSDLAAVRARAVADSDHWIINGQKVWSSWAHEADWGILLVRTDPTVPKHRGLTFFVVDMRTPGIDIRPIRQMSGAADFNETFFTDVRIPDSCRIGAVGEGWACAMTVLLGERLNQGGGGKHGGILDLIRFADETPRAQGSALDSSAVRLQLAQLFAQEQAEKYLQARLRTLISHGESPGAAASIIKLVFTNRYQQSAGLAMELRELAGLAADPGQQDIARVWHDYIWASALRVAGGADEILRNQIAERLLGMPGELRADKDVPFNQL